LEGKGIEPEHIVELSYEALREGRDVQMEHAIQVARQFLKRYFTTSGPYVQSHPFGRNARMY
jgi:hypothetical protein